MEFIEALQRHVARYRASPKRYALDMLIFVVGMSIAVPLVGEFVQFAISLAR